MNLYTQALIFAAEAHGDQQRKYTGAPYITHPLAVAETVRLIHGTQEMIAAALLHDVVEDTGVPIEMVQYRFGPQVATLVGWLTDPAAVPGGPNRAARKAASLARLSEAPASAQTIKVADLLDNTSSIVKHDLKFATTYLVEKQALLQSLTRANPELRARAHRMVITSLMLLSNAPALETDA